MIMIGTNITSNADELRKVQEDYLYNSLRTPKPVIESKIRQLRIIYCLDPKQYSQLKRALPYIVCGIFTPPYRRKENFAYIDHFIIDIDKLSGKGMDINDIRSRIQKDDRVMMCFTSPSEDGLKVMFCLKERCYDYGIYSIFYKDFLRKFSALHQLEQVIDSCTSDVSRACFISIDANAYYNPQAIPVDVDSYVNTDNTSELFDLKHELDKEVKINAEDIRIAEKESHNPDPDKDVMREIKAKLNPRSIVKEERVVFVPQQLEEIICDMKKYIEQTGIIVSDVKSIQYGKKIQSKLGLKLSEINVFFGKRGYSVVKSPKCGTNEELNDLLADMINSFLNEFK
jgi:hypothetical protein